MTEFDHNLDGLDQQIAQLEREREAWEDDGTEWYVGTAVEYAIYLEVGTSKMDPKPFLRPALHAYESNLRAAIAADTKTTVEEIDSVDELVQTIAFGLERRVKRIITQKGLIDTGALRASVQAVPTESALKGVSDVAARADVDLDPAEVSA
jgi:hypothetical protein